MPDASAPHARRRVLVVEDEVLLALSLEDHLRDHGWFVVGPYHDLTTARSAAAAEAFDCAILDVNLNGEMVFPLAEDLLGRAVPFLFVTGYAAFNLPEHLRAVPRVAKPYEGLVLIEALGAIVSG